MMRSNECARRDAELPLEETREVRLVGEAGPHRHVGERRSRGLEQAPSTLEPQSHEMLMRRAADRFLECAREVRERESRLTREDVECQLAVGLCVHQLEDALA